MCSIGRNFPWSWWKEEKEEERKKEREREREKEKERKEEGGGGRKGGREGREQYPSDNHFYMLAHFIFNQST